MSRRLTVALCALAAACVAERGPLTNRMAQSTTSYLTRAARHPVTWQPWGREAFALALRLDRPVLLYIGGDPCRWCAETDRAIYTDPEISGLINTLFVPIRVDRDERPDVAQRYQAMVHRLAGLRGWPLTVFLTPDGAPFFGGTYFPADDPVTGRGLKQILPEVAESYRDRRAFVQQHAALVQQLALAPVAGGAGDVLQRVGLRREIATLRHDLAAAAREPTLRGGAMAGEAIVALIGDFRRSGDSASLGVARGALDRLLDQVSRQRESNAPDANDDPPRLARAALLRALARAAAATREDESRYRDAGVALCGALARELAGADAGGGRGSRRGRDETARLALFTDQAGYVIEAVLLAAAEFGDEASMRLARAALDQLLQRSYARGWGVRHAAAGSVQRLLQDQVHVAAAGLAAFRATGDSGYLAVARDLVGVIVRDFADSAGGGFYDVAELDGAAPALVERVKPVFDDILPGANPWAARVLLRLAQATGEPAYRSQAEAALEAVGGAVSGSGMRAASFLAAASELLTTYSPN